MPTRLSNAPVVESRLGEQLPHGPVGDVMVLEDVMPPVTTVGDSIDRANKLKHFTFIQLEFSGAMKTLAVMRLSTSELLCNSSR